MDQNMPENYMVMDRVEIKWNHDREYLAEMEDRMYQDNLDREED